MRDKTTNREYKTGISDHNIKLKQHIFVNLLYKGEKQLEYYINFNYILNIQRITLYIV